MSITNGMPPLRGARKSKKSKTTKKTPAKSVKSDVSRPPMPEYEAWNRLVSKGRCTRCTRRKAKAPFLWCATCAREAQ